MLESYFEEILDPKDHWFLVRQKYWNRLIESGFLDGEKQAFQYVALDKIAWPQLATFQEKTPFSFTGFRIVFVDGFLSLEHSLLPSEVLFLSLDEAKKSFGIFLQNRRARLLKEEKDPLALINGALQRKGAFLYIPPQVKVKEPIHIYHVNTENSFLSSRLIVSMGKNSSLTLIERNRLKGSVGNCYLETSLDENAELDVHSCVEKQKILFQSFRSFLKRSSRLQYRYYSEGSEMVRNSIHIQLQEEGSEAVLKGLTVLDDDRKSHVHAIVEHIAPNARSRQHFKAVAKKSSLSSFEGKIYVHKEAQKTESYQLSNNLILSDDSKIYAKPNLEIFADDVKASHGATIAQLNDEELFYLRSRGFSKEKAHEYLIEGFIQELKECLP